MEDVNIHFIIPEKYQNKSQTSTIMQNAFEACQQNTASVSWIKESDITNTDLTKTDFVVFEDFTGENFQKISTTKCTRILGPWCLSICLTEGKSIPNYPWPIYNMAMSDCLVTCSNLPKKTKEQIKEKVQLMGARYSDSLLANCTHLITNSVKSEKYLLAAEAGVKIMCSTWVDAVWKASLSQNIHCNDEIFDKFRCLPFNNLVICTTGFQHVAERREIAEMISKNGGNLTGALKTTSTDILVVNGVNGSRSEKYKAARKLPDIKCVTVEWLTDSISKGYALPHNLYAVKKETSTPNKDQTLLDPNFSVMSAIAGPSSNRTTLEESVSGVNGTNLFGNVTLTNSNKKRKNDPSYKSLMDSLDIKKAKKAGEYLDGCRVYVTGFSHEYREKLCKVLNLSGATRFDDISDSVTHVIVGDADCHEVKLIRSKNYQCALVNLQWLLESIDKRMPVCEENYLISSGEFGKHDFNSPLSKRSLNLLRADTTLTQEQVVETVENVEENVDNEPDVMMKYMKPTDAEQEEEDTLARLLKNVDTFNPIKNPTTTNSPAQTSHTQSHTSMLTQSNTSSDQYNRIFENMKFILEDLDAEDLPFLQQQIQAEGGEILPRNHKGIPNYKVLPKFVSNEIRNAVCEVVNDVFLTECIQKDSLQEISYYHRPLVVRNANCLNNCVVTVSNYSGFERSFLMSLVEALGGVCQEQFSRITAAAKNIVASTHLVIFEASGKKYAAAIKWGLPAVDKDWLLECARRGELVGEDNFLVGAAKDKTTAKSIEKSRGTSKSSREVLMPKNLNSSFAKGDGTPLNLPGPSRLPSEVFTPTNLMNSFGKADKSPETPTEQKHRNTPPDYCSQVTPVNKIMQEVRKNNLLGPVDNSPKRINWMGVDTPETPLGACIRPNPSPRLRKEMLRYINQFPDYVPLDERRKSTPLSELKRRLLAKMNHSQAEEESGEVEDEVFEEGVAPLSTTDSPQNVVINNKLLQLEEMLNANSTEVRRNSRNFQSTIISKYNAEVKDSQAFTVGWDFQDQTPPTTTRIFMISGVTPDIRQTVKQQLENLGALVSDLSNYDPTCTHLICPKQNRNEKTLSCIAAGKWILHLSYAEKSFAAGKFLNEEEFEFGNPKLKGNIKASNGGDLPMQSVYEWRQEITRRGYGAFNDMRAIVVAARKDSIARVIEAGGGAVIEASPPFSDVVHATHCLLEPRSVSDFSAYIPLAKRGVLCINTLYISDYLFKTCSDVRDCILPQFVKYS